MSDTPRPETGPAAETAETAAPTRPRPRIDFDDPLDRRSADDTDRGWGERPSGGASADLARFLDEKPPHHV
ncbi:hypothetical protein ACN20G_15125 [Streptomyces sp. BI20]|uniref:hypothetical protein n=1 Tax=Streptomyces sp. BI20 TaxID=3403460 RepID=UPI003C730262